jgi:S1-C subfamily serine protease
VSGARAAATGAAALLAVACGACGDAGDRASAPPPPVVGVLAGSGAARDVATGVVIGDGRVLTVAHALAGTARVRVAVPGRGTRPARVLRRSNRLDVAVLAVAGLHAPRLAAAAARAGDGASLWVLRDGRPTRLRATVRRTITARVHELSGATRVRPGLELAVGIAKGDSGAPLVDAAGRILGLAFARAREGGDVAYAVDATATGALTF